MGENYSRRTIIKYLESTNWTSGNKVIDSFIQEKQSDTSNNIIFEWISFYQFKFIVKEGNGFATAIWMGGPLYYNFKSKEWERRSNKKVILKYLFNPQNIFDKLLMKVCKIFFFFFFFKKKTKKNMCV
jgi:hypothetical protein